MRAITGVGLAFSECLFNLLVCLHITLAGVPLLGDERFMQRRRRRDGSLAGLMMSMIQILLYTCDSLLRAHLRNGRVLFLVALRYFAAAGGLALIALGFFRVPGLTVTARLLLFAFVRADLLRRRVIVALGARWRILLLGYSRQLRATAGIRHAYVS